MYTCKHQNLCTFHSAHGTRKKVDCSAAHIHIASFQLNVTRWKLRGCSLQKGQKNYVSHISFTSNPDSFLFPFHRTSLFIVTSLVYAMLLIVVCIAYVISDVTTHRLPVLYYEGFFTYLYGASILFLLYVFCFLLQGECLCCMFLAFLKEYIIRFIILWKKI